MRRCGARESAVGVMVAPELSVVIVAFESANALPGCLRAVRALRPDAEIIVVDNASAKAPPDRAALEQIGARLVVNSANDGFGRACNRGAREARGRFVLFVNPDVRVESLPSPAELAGAPAGGYGLVAPAGDAKTPRTQGLFREPGLLADAVGLLLAPYWPRNWGRPPWAHRRGRDWASGCAFLVDRAEFLQVGGFSEDFFFLYEDRELCRRYREHGLPLRAAEGFTCHHALGSSVSGYCDDLATWRRYVAVLGLIEYWYATRGYFVARRWGRALIAAHRMLAVGVGVLGKALRTRRLEEKAEIEARVMQRLRCAEPIQGSLRVASAIAQGSPSMVDRA